MRNFFQTLNLPRVAQSEEISQAIDMLSDTDQSEEADLIEILESDTKSEQYRRVHLQYDAMATFLAQHGLEEAQDTHLWHKRLVEFESES